MTYTSAVRLTCFVRDAEHQKYREKQLAGRIGVSVFQRVTMHELASRVVENESLSWSLSAHSCELPLFELRLFVNHLDGNHENVCLETERSLIADLLKDRLVDVADFSRGLPKKNPIWLKKYEPGEILGTRSFVALALLKDGLFPDLTSIRTPLQNFLATHWMLLEEEREHVSLTRDQRRSFELKCSKLRLFREISDGVLAAAKRL